MTRTLSLLLALGLLAVAPLAGATNDNNAGTVKVHDDETVEPPTENQPHVSCDFWIEGFGLNDASGYIEFFSWPPTGDGSMVTPTGASLTWTGSADEKGNFDFLNGPYQLPAGHYRVEIYTFDGHPGNESHYAKSKVFWVDECQPTTEIPFFPTAISVGLAAVGVVAVMGFVILRRK